jgi:proton-translocating NAD(P)+ transhydrogenase subunit beta
MNLFVELAYIASAACFIVGLKKLSSPKTARYGNFLASIAMLVAIIATLINTGRVGIEWILVGAVVGGIIGAVAAIRVQMTGMPELVALLNGSGGFASALVALGEFAQRDPATLDTMSRSTIGVSVLIGAVTLTGSVVAFAKLAGKIPSQPITYKFQNVLNGLLFLAIVGLFYPIVASTAPGWAFLLLLILSFVLGVLLVIPIGGADMPVVISLLNSYSGLAACATGFVIRNELLITAGALVGAAGIILTAMMCKAMNRSITNVIFGAFGVADSSGAATTGGGGEKRTVRNYGVIDAAMMLESASSVIIVPGYGLAVARAQHATQELAQLLEENDTTVRYAIHPVAGRMPGHMNVLLAEADVPYEQLVEMDQINPDFESTDVVLVLGANDVVNPAARDDPTSPIYGMPILEVDKARTVIISKRSLGSGFAGVDNELFYNDKTMMIFGDAKKTLTELIESIRNS